jgi:hypothetical protein
MVDSRLSGIRPLLDVGAGHPELEGLEERRTIKSSLTVRNFGRGPAYAVRGDVSLRYEKTGDKTWIGINLEVPSIIRHGDECVCPFSIFGFPTPMDESRKNFLIVLFAYQDGEGNYYSLKQEYDLRAFNLGEVVSRSWQLRLEEIRFSKFSRRRRDRSKSPHVEHSQMDLLMHYKLPRVQDWTK